MVVCAGPVIEHIAAVGPAESLHDTAMAVASDPTDFQIDFRIPVRARMGKPIRPDVGVNRCHR